MSRELLRHYAIIALLSMGALFGFSRAASHSLGRSCGFAHHHHYGPPMTAAGGSSHGGEPCRCNQ